MSPFWMVVIGLWCSAVFALTGCDTRVSHPDPAADVYLSESANVATNQPPSLSVSNKVGGSITVGTGDNDKIAADVIATGVGADLERALEEADGHFVLTNTITNIGNEVQVAAPGANAKDSAQLQVRVPPGTILSSVTIPAGDITVHGKLGNVKAIVAGQGNINLLGPGGEIDLSTGQGSITAKLAPGDNDVTARTQGGNVDIMAASAAVTATTTNGDVRFIGSLRDQNQSHIDISGSGNIDVALLPYQPAGSGQPDRKRTQPYQVLVTTSANPIIAEYPLTVTVDNGSRALTICGFIHSPGPYDYHIENTPVRHFGRIEVSPAATTTFFFSGTLGADFYRFDTDRPNVLIYAPVPQSIHIYTEDQLNRFMAHQDPIDRGCEGALNSLAAPAIVMNLKTGRGRVSIRHIFSKQD